MFNYTFQTLIPEDLFKCLSHTVHMPASDTLVFHHVLQKRQLSFISCFGRWEISISLSAWNRAFQKSSSHNTCAEVPDYTRLCSLSFCHHGSLSHCLRVCERETGKDREILRHISWICLFPFSDCHSHTHMHTLTDRMHRHLSLTIHECL